MEDGLRSQCKMCTAADDAGYRAAHREEIAAYRAEHRDETAAYSAAYRAEHSEERAAYHAEHREELAAYRRAWRIKHPDEFRAYYAGHVEEYAVLNRDWRAKNPDKTAAYRHNRRARKLGNGGTHTAEDIRAQYARQHGRCAYCNEKVGDTYHRDHVVPLILGGSNGKENIVIACPTCNLSKGAKHPMEFAGRLL